MYAFFVCFVYFVVLICGCGCGSWVVGLEFGTRSDRAGVRGKKGVG